MHFRRRKVWFKTCSVQEHIETCTMFWVPCLGPFDSSEWKCFCSTQNQTGCNALPLRRGLMSTVPALVLRLGSKFQVTFLLTVNQ